MSETSKRDLRVIKTHADSLSALIAARKQDITESVETINTVIENKKSEFGL